MSTKKLFDEDSEEEVAIKTENEYAKKYDSWREKEELHKLEQKYGSKALNSDASLSSDSEDESDEPVEVSEEVEKQFLKTLALLKTKDPRIYDPDYKFFDEKVEKEKEKEPEVKKLTFGDSDDSDDDDPNIFSIEKKAEIDHSDDEKDSREISTNEDKLKDYLTGKVDHVDQELENDLAPLRSLWSDPKINEGEAFLRDYILNKRYLEDGEAVEAGDRLRDDAELEEDEQQVEEQGKFERAYNFRFEEPDEEYLKRFPRTMNYIRPKDDRRSRKRAEVRARKEEEKRQKMEEIGRMKALKLKEIQQKIAQIKEVTGNHDLAFKEEDIEGDFDPEEHDRRMKALFDEQYYGEVDEQKPVFPDLDDELEIENWEKYDERQDYSQDNQDEDEDGPHCEDDNFNMDADYDPKQAKQDLLEELKRNMGKKRRNRKRKSKLAQLLAEDKPKFVPGAEQQYARFMDEYYRMDCEDVIAGDLPTRFKYRQVVPNDFGLTVEEILLADDKELTQWVPLKKIVKYRPENVEKGEVKTYAQKAADERLKKKILPSLFKDLPEEPEIVVPPEQMKKRKKKKKKNKEQNDTETHISEGDTGYQNVEENETEHDVEVKKKKNKGKRDVQAEEGSDAVEISENDNITTDENTSDKPKKNKKIKRDFNKEEKNDEVVDVSRNDNIITVDNTTHKPKKKKKRIHDINKQDNDEAEEISRYNDCSIDENADRPKKKKRKQDNHSDNNSNNQNAKSDRRNTEVGDENAKKLNKNSKGKPHKMSSKAMTANLSDSKLSEYSASKENSSSLELNSGNNKKLNKKIKFKNTFIIDSVVNESPSRITDDKNNRLKAGAKKKKTNLKRKLEPNVGESTPKKKQNKNKQEKLKQVNVKMKANFKRRNKLSSANEKSNNPLSDLSDERLKAYGLNPKKYRSFLKYKKF